MKSQLFVSPQVFHCSRVTKLSVEQLSSLLSLYKMTLDALKVVLLLPLISLLSHNVLAYSNNPSGVIEECIDKSSCKDDDSDDTKEDKIVVCYFTNWAWYRPAPANYQPANINASLCTHVNYAFAILDPTSLTIMSSDTWLDIDKKFYEQVTALKSYGLKILLSIGGWGNSAPDHWSRMLNNNTAQASFVSSVVKFLGQHNFDGLDVDLEYPGCPQGNRTAGLPSDKDDFTTLISELKKGFKKKKYLLTMTIAGGKSNLDECYSNMAAMCQTVDWVNVMAYDYYSYSDGFTGGNAPLCGSPTEFGVYNTVKYLLNDLQCPAHKLVLGVPFYAKTYQLASSSPPEFGVAVTGPGSPGPYTQANGTLAYYEVCLLLNNNKWQEGQNKVNDSYVWRDDQFGSLDSVDDITRKTCLIHDLRLRGAMFWALDYDDFNNMCATGIYPLLTALNKQLRDG